MKFSMRNVGMLVATTMAVMFAANMIAGRSPQARRFIRGVSVTAVPNKPTPNKPIAV